MGVRRVAKREGQEPLTRIERDRERSARHAYRERCGRVCSRLDVVDGLLLLCQTACKKDGARVPFALVRWHCTTIRLPAVRSQSRGRIAVCMLHVTTTLARAYMRAGHGGD